jgi:hypothetical protein
MQAEWQATRARVRLASTTKSTPTRGRGRHPTWSSQRPRLATFVQRLRALRQRTHHTETPIATAIVTVPIRTSPQEDGPDP